MIAVLGFLGAVRSNWQYVIMGGLLIWTGVAQLGWDRCKAGRIADRAEAQAAVIAFQEADAVKTRAIEDAHAAEVARLKGEANAREAAINRAPSGTACINSGAGRAFIDGLSTGKTGAGAPSGAGRARQAVPH